MKEKLEMLEKTVVELTNKEESEKVQQLEKVVKAMCRKVLSLEKEIKDMKKKHETEEEPSFNMNDIKYCSSTPKDDKEKVKKVNSEEDLLTCTECSYKCKKEKSMKKHIITNHENHQCKECQEKLPTFMELLKHVAKHHCKEKVDMHESNCVEDAFEKPEESLFNKQKDNVKEGKKEKVKVFVFGESILNDFM